MSTKTITSLAILKVNIDQGKDYLDYLRPFILQILFEHNLYDPIKDNVVSCCIREQFGLEIPMPTVQLVLRRIAKSGSIRKVGGVYRKTGELPDPQIGLKQAEVKRHIESVVDGLRKFSQERSRTIDSDEEAVGVICSFLAEFNITCLRAFLRGTALPDVEGSHQTDIVLVSNFIQQVRRTDPERFDSFLIFVQGHMLANALLCPDLLNNLSDYRNVTFYFDAPLLIQRLGCEGEAKETAARELIALVRKLKGEVAAFSHSRQELQNVLQNAAFSLENSNAPVPIVIEARRQGLKKSDLLLLIESIDDRLSEAGIKVEATPRYNEKFQIDEAVFGQVLGDEVSYKNPRAREYDINSVRSIYVMRANTPAPSVEKARAVFVTSNFGLAKAAWVYGQKYETTRSVSSVITDFSLANIAWLKAPMGAPNIPTSQLLAFSYATLQPSSDLLDKYLQEMNRLEAQGTITERDHQLLRSSPLVYPELMNLTLGNDASLTEETITEILERVSSEIIKEESERLTVEQKAHEETQEALESERAQNREIVSNLYWRSLSKARILAWAISGGIVFLLIIGLLWGWIQRPTSPIVSWVVIGGVIVLALLTLGNLVFGSTVKDIHVRTQKELLTWFLKSETKSIGVDLSEFNIDLPGAVSRKNRDGE